MIQTCSFGGKSADGGAFTFWACCSANIMASCVFMLTLNEGQENNKQILNEMWKIRERSKELQQQQETNTEGTVIQKDNSSSLHVHNFFTGRTFYWHLLLVLQQHCNCIQLWLHHHNNSWHQLWLHDCDSNSTALLVILWTLLCMIPVLCHYGSLF